MGGTEGNSQAEKENSKGTTDRRGAAAVGSARAGTRRRCF